MTKNKNEKIELISYEILQGRIVEIINFYENLDVLIKLLKLKKLFDKNEITKIFEISKSLPEVLIEKLILEKIKLKITNLLETGIPESEEDKKKEFKLVSEYLDNFHLIPMALTWPNPLSYISKNYPELFSRCYAKTIEKLDQGVRNPRFSYLKIEYKKFIEKLIRERNLKMLLENIEDIILLDTHLKGEPNTILKDFIKLLNSTEPEEIKEFILKISEDKLEILYKNFFSKYFCKASFYISRILIDKKIKKLQSTDEQKNSREIETYNLIREGLLILENYEENLRSITTNDQEKNGLPSKVVEILIERERSIYEKIKNDFYKQEYGEIIEELSSKTGGEVSVIEMYAYLICTIEKILHETNIIHAWGKGARPNFDSGGGFVGLESYLKSHRFLTSLDILGIEDFRAKVILGIARDYFGLEVEYDRLGVAYYDKENQIIYGYLSTEEKGKHGEWTHRSYGKSRFIFDKEKILNKTTFSLLDSSVLRNESLDYLYHSLRFPGAALIYEILHRKFGLKDLKRVLSREVLLKELLGKEKDEENGEQTRAAGAYLEIQIHNSVSMREVSEIHLHHRSDEANYIKLIDDFNRANNTNIKLYFDE